MQLYRKMEETGPDVATTLGFGGPLGGGKSSAIRRICLARRFQYPKTTGVIIRRVYDEVKGNHIDPMLREYPQLLPCYRKGDAEIHLPGCGSTIKFMYAETTAEVWRKFPGLEFFDIFLDQAEQFSEEEIRIIKTRNRWPGAPEGLPKTGLFLNPGGAGAEFLRRIFWLKQFKIEAGERPNDFYFLQAFGWDNYQWFTDTGVSQQQFYALSSEERFELFIYRTQYGRELNALPPSLRAGALFGSFDSFEGQYYAGVWDDDKCVLTRSQCEKLIQPWWNRWTATDWGFAHNAAHIWFASGKVGPQQYWDLFGLEIERAVDVVVAYRELVVDHMEEQDLARMCVEMTPVEERKYIRDEFLSPDAFAKRGSGNTIAETFEDVFSRAHLPRPTPADNDRVGGWRLMYSGFKQSSSMRSEIPVMSEDQPMFLIGSDCPNVISSVPILIRNKKDAGKLEDVLKTDSIADDVCDALRYGYKSMIAPRKTVPLSVQREEIAAAAPNKTALHLSMLKFSQQHSTGRNRAR